MLCGGDQVQWEWIGIHAGSIVFYFVVVMLRGGDSIIVFLVTRIMEFPNFLISFSHLGSRVFVFVY